MKTLRKTFYGLFILLIVGAAGLFLATLLPIPGNVEVKIVKSGSMEPTIPTGSLVFVKPKAEYSVGDIITFGQDTKSEIPTTHRITEVQVGEGGTVFMTKGDANEEGDPQPVPASEVIGLVWFHVPYAGYIIDLARQPWGFTFLIGIPAALIIMDEALRIISEVREMRRRRREGTIGLVNETNNNEMR
ncbi:MAG: signal peptidase I [Patescibacteria group bacterium]